MYKIAINGFGRIGRVAFRILHERNLLEHVVAVNDLTDAPTLAHLLQYDSNYGKFAGKVSSHVYENHPPYTGALHVDKHTLYVLSVKEPQELPWHELGVDVVIECTGRFTTAEDMQKHIQAGAKKVLLSAPAEGPGVPTIVRGINDEALTDDATLVSNASCTTNSITPVASVILKQFGIEKAMMTTIHSYTADQELQDGPHKDLRRARAAAQNIVPTTTGATKAAAQAVTELEGIFSGLSVRVPTPVGSLSDFTFLVKKDTTVEEVNAALTEASQQPNFKGILEVSNDPLVSSDIVRNPASSIVDLQLTQVVGGNLVKVVAWYDNEWGYANRLVDQAITMAGLGKDTKEVPEAPVAPTAPTQSVSVPVIHHSAPVPQVVAPTHPEAALVVRAAVPAPPLMHTVPQPPVDRTPVESPNAPEAQPAPFVPSWTHNHIT